MEHSLNAEHCLAIAAAFIAIIGACASLIGVANKKSDGLMKRYRELTREHREQPERSPRRTQIEEQIELFKKRTDMVSKAQSQLFLTIGLLILSIAIFIVLGLYIVYFNVKDETMYSLVHAALIAIGGCVAIAAACMFIAIFRLYLELGEARTTFLVEIRDCQDFKIGGLSTEVTVIAFD